MQNVQITQTLFLSLVRYHLMERYEEEKLIKDELAKKLDALAKREIYSKYKNAKTQEKREAARKEYLDRIGLSEDFRW